MNMDEGTDEYENGRYDISKLPLNGQNFLKEAHWFEIWSKQGYSMREFVFPVKFTINDIIHEIDRTLKQEGLTDIRVCPISQEAYEFYQNCGAKKKETEGE